MAGFQGDKEAANVAEQLAGVTLKSATPKEESERADLTKLDELYEGGKLDELHASLLEAVKEKPEDFELLWRLARSHIDIADMKPNDTIHREENFKAAEAMALKALELEGNNWATNKWRAISLANVGKFKGTKAKIEDGYLIKTHAEKAAKLNPNDATTEYVLGEFCLSVTELSWLERQAASLIYAAPPSSSYEEALEHFMKSDKIKPGKVRNTFSIALCYKKLKKYDEAKKWYKTVTTLKPETEKEKEFIKDAQTECDFM